MAVKVRDVEVENIIGESSKFRVYSGRRDDGQKVIVKVARTFEDGAKLAEDAKQFTLLKNFESYLRNLSETTAESASYNLLFARLESSFLEETQKDRRINIFTIPDADLDLIVPLPKLSSSVEIDSRTSVWIIGRLFKFYGMFELMREADGEDACSYPVFNFGDYLIGPKTHRLVYYNFSDEVYDIYATSGIKSIAKYILDWTSFDDSDEDKQYKALLEDMMTNGRKTAAEAHHDLYALVRDLWGYKYYPFTYRAKGTLEWKSMNKEEK